jgi:hypothetical protein
MRTQRLSLFHLFLGALQREHTPLGSAGNSLNLFKDCRTENGSSQDQELALSGLIVPNSLDSGPFEELPPPHTPLSSEHGTCETVKVDEVDTKRW